MQTNTKLLLVFAAGFIAGKNEDEIRRFLIPLLRLSDDKLQSGYSSVISFFLQHKEFVEDLFAESQAKTSTPGFDVDGKASGPGFDVHGNGATRWADSGESP